MRDIVVAVFLRNVNVIGKCKLSKMPFYANTGNLLIGNGKLNRTEMKYIVQLQKTTIIVIVQNSTSISHWVCKRWLS